MRVPCEHFWHAGHSVLSMSPPMTDPAPVPCPRSGAPHAGPAIDVAERLSEVVHPSEVFDLIARLGDEQTDVHQREHDATEVLGAGDAPMGQHGLGEEAELIAGEVTARPRELGAAHVAPHLEPGLQILDRGEHEEERPLVVGSSARADAREDIVGELQLVHAGNGSSTRVARRLRPADAAWPYSGKADASSSTSALTLLSGAASGWVKARSISSATRTISAVPMPRVVIAGVPMRTPLVTNGDWGSSGIVFLLTVIPASPSVFSAALPVRFLGLRSTSIRWVSVPPETTSNPRSMSAAARVLAL